MQGAPRAKCYAGKNLLLFKRQYKIIAGQSLATTMGTAVELSGMPRSPDQ